jgi:hypothetical protein
MTLIGLASRRSSRCRPGRRAGRRRCAARARRRGVARTAKPRGRPRGRAAAGGRRRRSASHGRRGAFLGIPPAAALRGRRTSAIAWHATPATGCLGARPPVAMVVASCGAGARLAGVEQRRREHRPVAPDRVRSSRRRLRSARGSTAPAFACTVVRPERTIVRDVDEVLPLVLASLALLGTGYMVVRVRAVSRVTAGRTH